MTYAGNVDIVAKEGRIIVAERRPDSKDPRGWTGKSLFREFPDDVIPRNLAKWDAVVKAVLFDTNCAEITLTGKPLLEYVLKGKFISSR